MNDAKCVVAEEEDKAILPCKPAQKRRGSDFLNESDFIEEGDTVIIYVNFGTVCAITVKRGERLNMRYGTLKHDFLIGKRYGSRVSATAGYVYVLRPSADLWTRTLPRRTQILYSPDSSLILLLLDIKPGSVICESGTGSGSLSHALAVAVAPTGHVYTHDIDEPRVRQVEEEFKKHGLSDVTTCINQDVCEDGFFVTNACDGVFLDLPAPWLAIKHAKVALSRSRGGRLVSFSPCVEQVLKVCEELRRLGFVQVSTVELVPKMHKVVELRNDSLRQFNTVASNTEEEAGGKRRRIENNGSEPCSETISDVVEGSKNAHFSFLPYPLTQPTHTGYLTSATLLPCFTS
ncbi:hypothetical protein AB6A40_000604 [Gnathostoma spinigerum]|uniref:tRNA (adenine(58)-N(1))-methyltransferase catalytic subunit TRMT61A n=1 Tax=Gnathostoma spinigerum TaxID=75299 RepID=A0ABD6E2F2_9BILA